MRQQVTAKAEELRKMWAQPSKTPGFWRSKQTTVVTTERLSKAEGNPLSSYNRILRDMDASKRAKSKEKQ